jgi:large subunit ribosomal protein L22
LEAKAVEKYIKMSPRKIKYVIDIVKKKSVEQALGLLSVTPKTAAVHVRKPIQSAAANATENFKDYKVAEDDLFIKEIFVTQGPTQKRFKPRAKGRADRVLKKSAHITVFVSDGKSGDSAKISKLAKKEAKV